MKNSKLKMSWLILTTLLLGLLGFQAFGQEKTVGARASSAAT